MKLDFEYGSGMMSAQLPDSTKVFIPGETVADPPCIPEERLVEETRNSVRNPIGMPPLSRLAHPGSRVVIVIPDIVKGGCQPTAHRKVAIRVILEELYANQIPSCVFHFFLQLLLCRPDILYYIHFFQNFYCLIRRRNCKLWICLNNI